jgi:tetratricopeptide (TPR) repeat protein
VWLAKLQHDKALADFTEAIRLDPTYADAWNGRAIVWHATGKYEQAVADFTEASRLDPT